ncbi:MAG: macrocin O-methyltransferase [bacterium]|nr:macrocin O-methyltransferase [bacterium]
MNDYSINLYLDLLKRCLLDEIYRDGSITHGVEEPYNPAARAEGRDWPRSAHTMVGRLRLDHLEKCLQSVLEENIAGDVIEAGVWRGGAAIFMRGVLKANQSIDRVVWAADSFQGLPEPDSERFPADAGDRHHAAPELAVSLDEVQSNFERYGLLDNGVRFLPGWFHETLPEAPIKKLSLIRLDGDMYESTWVALEALYDKLSPGGYLIVDDYGAVRACRKAVEDFRAKHGIEEPIETIDWTGAFWRKRLA